MQEIRNMTLDAERALYDCHDTLISNCRFDGPADGESAFKEGSDFIVEDCYFNLRYPFWHDSRISLERCEMTANCRAALWYTDHAKIADSKLHGIKALRECNDIEITDTDVISPEFGWNVRDLNMLRTTVESEYFMFGASNLSFDKVELKGKYSFQYVKGAQLDNCVFNTKDAFWHSSHVTVRDSIINGEYLGWYADHLTLINCKISGTQPLCYCANLRLINCEMVGADFAFEKSDVYAELNAPVISIKNPYSGEIKVPAVGEIIRDDARSNGKITITG